MIHYYQLLQISDSASRPEIQKAYRDRAREYHPDKLSGLGKDLQELGASKMLLINEAYRILKDDEARATYDNSLQNDTSSSIYVVCRSCGHSEAINPIQDTLDTCPVCAASMSTPRQAQYSEEFPWEALLYFLEQSHQLSHNRELPSSIYCKLDNLFFTLDQLMDGRFCLFTHFRMMHSQMESLFPDLSSPWDFQCEAGFVILGSTISEATQQLQRISSYFEPQKNEIYLNPGERGGPIFEPNIAFLSAVQDISFASSHLLWQKSNLKLNNCSFKLQEHWQDRLAFTVSHLYGKVRQKDQSRSINDQTILQKSVSGYKDILQKQLDELNTLFPQLST